MIGRRELLGDLWANLKFRLQGSTDAASEEIRDRVLHAIAGTPVRELQRLGPEILAGVLPRIYPEVLRVAYDHQDAGPARVHRDRRIAGDGRADGARDGARRRHRHPLGDQGRHLHGAPRRSVHLPLGQGARRSSRWPASAASTSRRPTPTPTRSPTCPMLRAVGHPVAVNPDAELERVAREEGWQIMRFDKLARRLKLGAAVGGVALVGGGGGYLVARLRPRPQRRRRLARREPSGAAAPYLVCETRIRGQGPRGGWTAVARRAAVAERPAPEQLARLPGRHPALLRAGAHRHVPDGDRAGALREPSGAAPVPRSGRGVPG